MARDKTKKIGNNAMTILFLSKVKKKIERFYQGEFYLLRD